MVPFGSVSADSDVAGRSQTEAGACVSGGGPSGAQERLGVFCRCRRLGTWGRVCNDP